MLPGKFFTVPAPDPQLMTPPQRLQHFIQEQFRTNVDAARVLGIKPQTLDKYLKGKLGLSGRAIRGKLTKFFGIELKWLDYGLGPMMVEGASFIRAYSSDGKGKIESMYALSNTKTNEASNRVKVEPNVTENGEQFGKMLELIGIQMQQQSKLLKEHGKLLSEHELRLGQIEGRIKADKTVRRVVKKRDKSIA